MRRLRPFAAALAVLLTALSLAWWAREQAVPDAAWVQARCEEIALTPEEARFERVAWSDDVRRALELGAKHRRPILLFYTTGPIGRG